MRRPPRRIEHRRFIQSFTDYDGLLKFQGGVCAICGRLPRPGERRFHRDHDHKAMRMRGIVCPKCNISLHQHMTPAWLRAAAAYLDDPPFDHYERMLDL